MTYRQNVNILLMPSSLVRLIGLKRYHLTNHALSFKLNRCDVAINTVIVWIIYNYYSELSRQSVVRTLMPIFKFKL